MNHLEQNRNTPTLSIIVPTLNERDNVPLLVEKLEKVLHGISWEVIFVDDDSKDGTMDAVHALATAKTHVRGIHRIGRRGLSSACIEGMLSSNAPYLAVMDADLQHDENLLLQMFEELSSDRAELVVASRYVSAGSTGDWARSRRWLSRLAIRMSRLVLHARLTDPMSGFFALRRELFRESVRQLSGIGFKILFDICASIKRPIRLRELPYHFRRRLHGSSKMNLQVAWDFLIIMLAKVFGRFLPVHFLSFSMVGSVGVLLHLLLLNFMLHSLGVSFLAAQTAATFLVMTLNFLLNNLLTFSDTPLRRFDMLKGWFSFLATCSIGAVVNISFSTYLFDVHGLPWLAASLAGITIGAVWNYATNTFYTWHR